MCLNNYTYTTVKFAFCMKIMMLSNSKFLDLSKVCQNYLFFRKFSLEKNYVFLFFVFPGNSGVFQKTLTAVTHMPTKFVIENMFLSVNQSCLNSHNLILFSLYSGV